MANREFHAEASHNRGEADVKPSLLEERLTRKTRSVLCNVMVIRGLVVLFAALSLMACSKTRSAAAVVAKEHIDIAEAKPSPSPQPTPVETEITSVEMKPDEIEVDGYVMKKDVRGTSKDPRARNEEQWRITVQIEDIGLRKLIQSDRAHYDKLKVGDRIKVAYYRGKYTGTVWAAEIED